MDRSWRDFRWLAGGKFVSDLGTYFDMVALNAYVYQLTGSGFSTALFMATRLTASFLASLSAGVLADRVSRKKLMLGADIARALAVASLALAPDAWHLPMLFGVAAVLGAGNALFDVALQASVPAIVGAERRVKANALIASAASIAMAVGCLTSGIFLTALTFRAAFAFDAATYTLSALNLFFLRVRTTEAPLGHQEPISFLKEARVVSAYLATVPVLCVMTIIRLGDALGSASHNVGLPVFAKILDPARPAFYLGVLYSTWAMGKLTAAVLSSHGTLGEKVKTAGSAEWIFGTATIAMSGAFIALFQVTSLEWLLALSLVAGAADGISEMAFVSRLQTVPDALRGRIFGVASTALTVGFGVGMVACSPFFDHYAPGSVVLVFHGAPLIMALLFSVWISSRRTIAASR